MNKILAEITKVQSSGELLIVELNCEGEIFYSYMIHSDNSLFEPGLKVWMMFKEMEVMLCKNDNPNLSVCNVFPVSIKSVLKGNLLNEFLLDFKSQQIVMLSDRKTCDSIPFLSGMNISAFVKPNDVMLLKYE